MGKNYGNSIRMGICLRQSGGLTKKSSGEKMLVNETKGNRKRKKEYTNEFVYLKEGLKEYKKKCKKLPDYVVIKMKKGVRYMSILCDVDELDDAFRMRKVRK